MVDIYKSKATEASMHSQTFPPDFTTELVMELLTGRSVFSRGTLKGRVEYHEE
jgi:hypothetical protein